MRRTAGPARGTARALVTTLLAGAALGVFAGTAPADTGPSAHRADAAVPGPAATDPLPCAPVPAIPDADPPAPGEDPAAWRTLPGADGAAPASAGTPRALAAAGTAPGPGAAGTAAPDPDAGAPDARARDAYGLPADDEDDGLLVPGAPGPDRAADGGCPPVSGDDAWGTEPGEDAPWSATSALPQGTTRPTCPAHPPPGEPCGPPAPPCPPAPHGQSHATPAPHGRSGGAAPDGSCATAAPEHGVRAGQGGAFEGSVPALAAGGVLIAGALGGAAHRLRPRRGGGEH
ncbi:hypothetical protein [Streptomyces sp. AD55]|uniref:hypothetical protein n=1 Tax=Streptomyces sp. AD55 TaxID=3242895 RepID=UPI003528E031